ncbi:MAG: phosphoribosylaminoimidazolecarboxamide formyltransferase/IMP cyclohydrolase [bacterium]|jgi:phosphoribosylaminoimidazolecarboxamide formyltransferase/IMP cyclohydrolase
MKIQRALVSVSDKAGIVDFSKDLHQLGIEIISTGGTAKTLKEAGIPVIDISDYTGFPEIMDGRVKTLNPKVHGGILARRSNEEHMNTLQNHNIPLIDLVVVNLYPFLEVTKDENVELQVAVENIDIGGPTMLRASAKNYEDVTVVTDPTDYDKILGQIKENGKTDIDTRAKLAIKVFHHTAQYDSAIDSFLTKRILDKKTLHQTFTEGKTLRYGENSHQQATFYINPNSTEQSVANTEILNGKEMSYNNYVDANAALEAVKELPSDQAAVAVIKHTNPCGLATGATGAEALEKAWQGDPISAFGGVIATNQTVDLAFAEFLKGENVTHYAYKVVNGEYVPEVVKTGKFVEIVIAPDYTDEALAFLKKKSKMIRLLKTSPTQEVEKETYRAITGGILVQDRDKELTSKFEVSTKKEFAGSYKPLAEFTWVACKHTKSNAIVLGREYAPGKFQVLGMGAGQPNRVDSLRKLALPKAKENLALEFKAKGMTGDFEKWCADEIAKAVLVSDAFFPFDDTVREAAELGIKYLVQPGGSMRDQDSIDACDELGMAMAFTGNRHFNH